MKHFILTLICIVLVCTAYAQQTREKVSKAALYRNVTPPEKQILPVPVGRDSFFSVKDFSRPVFYKIVSRDFLSIARSGNENPGTASYAFADVASPSVNLGAAFAIRDKVKEDEKKDTLYRTLVSVNAKAGITENTAELFSNTKFSGTFSGQILFSHLLGFDVYSTGKIRDLAHARRNRLRLEVDSISYRVEKYQKALQAIDKLEAVLISAKPVDSVKVLAGYRVVPVQWYKDTVITVTKDTLIGTQKIAVAEMHTLVLPKKRNDTIPIMVNASLPGYATGLSVVDKAQIGKEDTELYETVLPGIWMELRDTMADTSIEKLIMHVVDLRFRALYKLNELNAKQKKTGFTDFKGEVLDKFTDTRKKYVWIGYGLGVNNTEFRLYNPHESPLLNNISAKKTFTAWNTVFRVNHYQENNVRHSGNFYFFSELALGRAHNLADLRTTGYTRSHSVKDADTSKTVTDTYTVYRNPYGSDYKQYYYARLAFSHLHFFSKARMVGLTGYLAVAGRFAKHALPTFGATDMGLGLFLSLPNKKKGDPVVNMELYARFQDVFNVANLRDSRFYDRNLIAIKIGVPFRMVTQ